MFRFFLTGFIILNLFLSINIATTFAAAKKIIYIPPDDRPICLDYTVETVKAAGVEVIVPPSDLLASRTSNGDPDQLWRWLFDQCVSADALVLSSDTLIYGGLVSSRTHYLSDKKIKERVLNFTKLKELNSTADLYVFSSVMRSPKISSGGVEPPYYEQYGSSIFRLTALEDKSEIAGLTESEQDELRHLKVQVPKDVLQDWLKRREVNLKVNFNLLDYCRQGVFNYFIIGRDDNASFSQSHKESRLIAAYAEGIPNVKYQSMSGTDELGMILLTRAVNRLNWQWPTIAVKYAPGVGKKTVPSYADQTVEEAVMAQIFASGAIPLLDPVNTDMVLFVNTPEDGETGEAGETSNKPSASESIKTLVSDIQTYLNLGGKVLLADIAYANGADNALMNELERNKMLPYLTAYSGWNTPNNTLGFVIGQGILASNLPKEQKDRLLFIRYLDDWGYQANIRTRLVQEVVVPYNGKYNFLNKLEPILKLEAEKRFKEFIKLHLDDFPLTNKEVKISFPWNRMFEIKIDVK